VAPPRDVRLLVLLAAALLGVAALSLGWREGRRHERDEGERHLREAIDLARHRSQRILELRATTSLARLWRREGRRGEAHQMLGEIYGWFAEGFDTADLRGAKALLDELSAGPG